MNALQARMMSNAMAHQAGMASAGLGGLEGMGLGPRPANQRALISVYEDADGARSVPQLGYKVPGSVFLNKLHPNKKKLTPEAKAAWVAANPVQARLLAEAHEQRAKYSFSRKEGNFEGVANLKAKRRAEMRDRKLDPNYVPQPISHNLQRAQEARKHNTYLKDALGKAVADKYRRAANAAEKAGTTDVIVDGILLDDPFEAHNIFAHRKKVLDAKAAEKASRIPRANKPLSMKPAAVASRARNALIKSALDQAGIIIPKTVRGKKKKKKSEIVIPSIFIPQGPLDVPLAGQVGRPRFHNNAGEKVVSHRTNPDKIWDYANLRFVLRTSR